MTELDEILKKRQIETVYYFHTDHFEPWSLGLNETTARGVERFGDMARSSPFARKLSLFYCPYVPYHLSGSGETEALVFGKGSATQSTLARGAIQPLVTADLHELHLHVHHEFWTKNQSNFDSPVSRWVNANSTGDLDKQRLDKFFKLCKEIIADETDKPFDSWGFIHGNWALAGSDPLICNIDNELSTIIRHGGFGDFSFPAGRSYCDPRLPLPFTCLPIDLRRAYDQPAADPRPVGAGLRAFEPGRFFIWNSPIKAKFSSLDYYTEANRETFRDPARVVSEWLMQSVSLGNGLFIKTHAHSMKWEYKIHESKSMIPHCYPDVVKIFETLQRTCDRAGVEIRLVTVNEVMNVLRSADSSDPVQVTAAVHDNHQRFEQNYTRGVAEHRRATTFNNKSERDEKVADRLKIPRAANPQFLVEAVEADMLSLLLDWIHSDLQRREGAGSFYLKLVDTGKLLQDYERAVFDYVTARFATNDIEVVEVGVGFGILSLLLAAAGYHVIAFEGEPHRYAGFQFLADSLSARYQGISSKLRRVFGWFPDAFDQSLLSAARRKVLITTNVVATATAERQDAILGVAPVFDDLLIDTTRFGVRRYDPEAAKGFRAILATIGRPISSVWQNGPNEIWHFQTGDGQDERTSERRLPTKREVEEPDVGSPIKGRAMVIDFDSFNHKLLRLQRSWVAGDGSEHQPDTLYAHKHARGITLEPYEIAIATAVAERYDTNTLVVEIGSGYGAFALLLAQYGFTVRGFEGDRRRAAAFAWHLQQYRTSEPKLAGRLDVVAGFFPDELSPDFCPTAEKRICIATNVTCTYTAMNQDAILSAVRTFDDFIVDLARFGRVRNTQEERDALRDHMSRHGFEAIERLYSGNPYEYWHFRTLPEGALGFASTREARTVGGSVDTSVSGISVAEASPPDMSATPNSRSAVFPLQGRKGVLYSIYGSRQIEICPVCHSRETVRLWQMPMAPLKEAISLFGGYFNQVPTLEVPGTVYCFDFCHDCESVFLNPAPALQKEQYRKTDHYIRMMKNDAEWQGYENAFDRFAKWIPADASAMIDAACGVGQYIQVARRREPNRWQRLVGLELSEKYVEHMREQAFEAYVFDVDRDDLTKIVPPESMDFITFCEAFEHVERPLDALQKLLVALRPGGRLYFTAQRYGRDVQAAIRPGEPIYIGERVMSELPERLKCRVVDVTTSNMRYYVILEK